VQGVVERGALLENESFHVALRILDSYISARSVEPDDLLIMNGLPRHIGQAEAIAPYLSGLVHKYGNVFSMPQDLREWRQVLPCS